MIPSRFSSSAVIASTVVLVLTLLATIATAQPQPTPPFAPDWAMLAGFDVFAKKGCGKCHAIRGGGSGPGPDLGRIKDGASFYELGAALWNHLPAMGARMHEAGVDRPTLSAREVSDLLAFLFTAQYYDELGDAKVGERQFTTKGCVQCHSVGGRGGNVGPPLDPLKRANSPVLVAAAMWNHGPEMAEAMKARGIVRPTFQNKEILDLIAHIVASAKDTGGETAQVVPGTPERGEKLFAERHCASCHAVGGKGGRVGPDLGRSGHHISLTRFTALMWNHGPEMWKKMKARGIAVPKLTGQETADILAYLYTARYFDRTTNPRRGQQLVQDKGCVGCHSVRGQGGKIGPDLATSTMTASPSGMIAAMWNHAAAMEEKARQRGVTWPRLTGQELGDLTAYLNSLPRQPAPKTQ